MKISGFIKNSLIDYPGKLSSVIFTQGCNMRCKFCHNYELIPTQNHEGINYTESHVLNYLSKAKGFVDAVVITGGEPGIQDGLESFITKVKELGLFVKLDTNGTNPELLQKLLNLNLLDYVAMDVKTRLELAAYQNLVGNQFDQEQLGKVKKSINLLNASKVEVEFRTTLLKEVHTGEDVLAICSYLRTNKKISWQQFNPKKVLAAEYAFYSPYTKSEMKAMSGNHAFSNSKMRFI